MALLSFREQTLRAREEAIVAAVNRLLADKGFDLMTVDEVAADVGIAKASLYKHFPSKEALAAAAMVRLLERTRDFVDEQGRQPLTAFERLQAVVRWALEQQLAGAMPTVPSQNSSLRAELMAHRGYLDLLLAVSETLGLWIVQAQTEGDIDAQLPPEVVLYTVFARACDPVPAFLKASGQHSDAQIVDWVLSTCLNGLGQAQGVAHHAHGPAPGALHAVVVAAMQVAVEPEIGPLDEVVVGIAEAGGAGLPAVTRIGAAQARTEVSDHHRLIPTALWRRRECRLQPGPAGQGLLAHGRGVKGLTVSGGAHQAQEVGGCALGAGPPRRAVEIEIAPARGAHEPDALPVRGAEDGAVVLQQGEAQVGTQRTQAGQSGIEVATVEFMVAGHHDDGHRPAGKALVAVPAAVDVARQHQHLGPRGGPGLEGLGLEVQVGQELQLHAATLGPGAGCRARRTPHTGLKRSASGPRCPPSGLAARPAGAGPGWRRARRARPALSSSRPRPGR